jgi:hypothetical protein
VEFRAGLGGSGSEDDVLMFGEEGIVVDDESGASGDIFIDVLIYVEA